MNYAVIDLGSNSIRLSIYNCDDQQIARIFTKKEIAGLIGYVADGQLDTAGIQRACEILADFKEDAVKFVDPANIHLFATASLRDIGNQEEVINAVLEKTALRTDVLTGDEEAELDFVGVSHFLNCEDGIMIDIGGASTELVLFKERKAVDMISLPIGCLNLSIDYVKEIIPDDDERKKIKAIIKEQFSKVNWAKGAQYPLMVGVGGTARAALKLSHALFAPSMEENSMDALHIKEINRLLKNRKSNIYRTLYKHTPERLLTISTGLAILQQTIKTFGCKTIVVSKYGLREGYLIKRVLDANCVRDADG